MAATCGYMAKESLISRLNPFKWAQRSIVSTIGPAKDWANWKHLFLPFQAADVPVGEMTAQSVPAYFRALNVVSEQIASLPWSVHKQIEGGVEEYPTHPLYKLLKFRPSPLYNTFEFRETLTRQVMLRGEAFVHIHRNQAGSVRELEILPKATDFFQGKNGLYYWKFDDRTLLSEEVLHFKAYSLDGIRGISPLALLSDSIGLGMLQIKHGANHFANGTTSSGLLVPDAPMKPEQVDQALNYWDRFNSGPTRSGRAGIMPFGLKYQALASTLKDSQYVEGRHLTTEDVANITGVPIDLLNSGDKTSTYASAEQRMRQFVLFTLRTWCKRFEEEMNSKLFPAREMGRTFVKFNLDGLLRGDTEARSTYYNTLLQNGVLTRNEVRELEGRNPMPGGDSLMVPLNMQDVNNTSNEQEGDGEEDV
jgi:HK97 family phage portal protein